MSRPGIPKETLRILKAIKGKRAKIVVNHMLKHGAITTKELKEKYGYDHPPRAIRDVLEQGIPLEKSRIVGSDGWRIAQYRFGDLTRIQAGRIGGRRAFPKAFKDKLVEKYGLRCGICHTDLEARYLQIDHRIPYQVAGETLAGNLKPDEFMLVCGSCNRAKSWSCEHCENGTKRKDPTICQSCYWAPPRRYKHIAMRESRRLDVVWIENEVHDYERLRKQADAAGEPMPQYVKEVLKKSLPPSESGQSFLG